MNPVVVAVAITGSVPRKKDNPALPTTPAEQIESAHEAFEAGASLVHVHARNPDESSSSDPDLFRQVQAGIARHCPGMIVQFSTGGRGRDPAARGSALHLRPDMASLSTGSVNFPTIVYENSATLVVDLATKMKQNGVRPEIEIFDLSHLHGAKRLVDAGLMDDRPHVQLVMGVKNAMPAEERLLDLMLGELRHVLPNATWTAAGIGSNQSRVMGWALGRGADGAGGQHPHQQGPPGREQRRTGMPSRRDGGTERPPGRDGAGGSQGARADVRAGKRSGFGAGDVTCSSPPMRCGRMRSHTSSGTRPISLRYSGRPNSSASASCSTRTIRAPTIEPPAKAFSARRSPSSAVRQATGMPGFSAPRAPVT